VTGGEYAESSAFRKINLKQWHDFKPHFNDIFSSTFTTHFTTFTMQKTTPSTPFFQKPPVKTLFQAERPAPDFFPT